MRQHRTQVAIIGAGPAGTLLSLLLTKAGIDNVLIEQRSRAYVLSRIRAGVLEHRTVEVLRALGVAARLEREGQVHQGVELAFAGQSFRIDFAALAGVPVVVYGQTEVQKDLYAAHRASGSPFIESAQEVRLGALTNEQVTVSFVEAGVPRQVICDYVAGCDGQHGVSRAAIPSTVLCTYERAYSFGWLGILSETPPVHEELIYANHERGFALCSLRSPRLSRYYLQCPLDSDLAEWTDERFWSELTARLPPEVGKRLVTGPSIEKSVAPLRSVVIEPMRYGRLFLAGDAAHILPPTGAKGLNLAVSDVVALAQALSRHYRERSSGALDDYSDVALRRVWRAVRFSWWMTTLMHRLPEGGAFAQRIQETELALLAESESAQRVMAQQYVGLL